MAMCAPTACATPRTLTVVKQCASAQTLNVRLLLTVGGPAAGDGCGTPVLAAGAGARDIAIDATGVADCSVKAADDPAVPPADHGSTRYSAVSAPVFAA